MPPGSGLCWRREGGVRRAGDTGMSPGPTFDRVYVALKGQLTGGRFAPGDHLEPAAIGDELSASITPVRDALHRLVGERIVEAPRNDGFRVPSPTEAELRDLYGWNRELLELGLRFRRPPSKGARLYATDQASEPACLATADLFLEIARRSSNPELESAIENLNDRLGALRKGEGAVFEDLVEELGLLLTAFRGQDAPALRRLIAIYHRRRQRHAPELLLATRAQRQAR